MIPDNLHFHHGKLLSWKLDTIQYLKKIKRLQTHLYNFLVLHWMGDKQKDACFWNFPVENDQGRIFQGLENVLDLCGYHRHELLLLIQLEVLQLLQFRDHCHFLIISSHSDLLSCSSSTISLPIVTTLGYSLRHSFMTISRYCSSFTSAMDILVLSPMTLWNSSTILSWTSLWFAKIMNWKHKAIAVVSCP